MKKTGLCLVLGSIAGLSVPIGGWLLHAYPVYVRALGTGLICGLSVWGVLALSWRK
jgi:hypothetical protein